MAWLEFESSLVLRQNSSSAHADEGSSVSVWQETERPLSFLGHELADQLLEIRHGLLPLHLASWGMGETFHKAVRERSPARSNGVAREPVAEKNVD
eukprot:3184620-Pyramimonas_sp.AAC.1